MKSKSEPSDSFIIKYDFIEKKGEGGFGKAFVVYDNVKKKEYISKFILIKEKYKHNKEIIKEKNDLFKREIKVLTELTEKHNPNIIEIIDSGEANIERLDHKSGKKIYDTRIC